MSFIFLYHTDFLRPKIASIINTTAATINNRFIKLPPILKISPISQNNTTKPPIHRKTVIYIPPLFTSSISNNTDNYNKISKLKLHLCIHTLCY